MQPCKLEHFVKDHSGKTFPAAEVKDSVPTAVQDEIARRLGLNASCGSSVLLTEIRDRSELLANVNAEASDFNLSAVLKKHNIPPSGTGFLNWDRFESLDQMAFADAIGLFEYLWYPASDDLEIISTDTRWVLSVAHS